MFKRLRRLWRDEDRTVIAASADALAQAAGLLEIGRTREAVRALRECVAQRPDQAGAWAWLGRALLAERRHDEALEAFDEAIDLERAPAARALLEGERAGAAGDVQAALAAFTRAHALLPDDTAVTNRLALAMDAAGQAVPAEDLLRRSLATAPAARELSNTLGALLARTRGIDAAAPVFEQALALHPGDAALRYNFAVIASRHGRKEAAVHLYRQVLDLEPRLASARLNLALDLLHLGRLREAWPEFESRWQASPDLEGAYVLPPARQWRGEALEGRRLLVWAEQGLGDSLQMLRFIPLLAARGAGAVHVRLPRTLLELARGMPGVTSWIAEEDGADRTAFDLHCPFLSLPLAFDADAGSLPAALPYLRAPASHVQRWADRLPAAGAAQLRVGLVWNTHRQGNARFDDEKAERSIPLPLLAPLMEVPGIRWVSLQLAPGSAELEQAPRRLEIFDAGREIADFRDTAAVVEQLDLVVSIDTSVVHLAGALARPVLMLLRASGGLLWMQGREDSPWYPGVVRILRQPRPGHWEPVIEHARALLAHFAQTRSLWEDGKA